MKVFLVLTVCLNLTLAWPMEEEVGIVPEVEASKVEKAEARFVFVQAYSTVYQTVGTSTLSTFPSCYTTEANIATCSSTVLSGKRRKREEELMVPEAIVNGQTVDMRDVIKASRVSRNDRAQSPVLSVPQIFEASIKDVPQCLLQGRNGEERQPRLITVTTTVTSFTFATATVTPATTQTFSFKSGAGGDAAANARTCFPAALMSSASISRC